MKTEERIKLKHLAPYLPYDLKFRFESGKEDDLKDHYFIYSICPVKNWACISNLKYDAKVFIPQLKPLLHPLSRLTEPILEGGKRPVDLIFEYAFGFEPNGKYGFSGIDKVSDGEIISFHHADYQPLKSINADPIKMPYEYFEMLVKWHFDVFNLIGRNLAIPIPIDDEK